MKGTLKVTLGGTVGALSVVLMFLCSLIPFGTFAFPMLAGMLLVVIVIECGYPWAFSVYGAVSVLSFLLVSDKEAALFYAVFLGYYPIIKSLIERVRSRALQIVIKLCVFNAAMIAAFYIGTSLLSVPRESYTLFGVYLPWLFLLLANAVFLLYDLCISRLAVIYLRRFHDKLKNNTKL